MCGALQVCTGREPGDLPCWALRGFPCCCPHSHSGTAPAGGLLEPVTKPTAVAAPGTDGQVLPQQVGLGVGTALWMAFSSGLIAASVNYWACSFCIHAISWCVPITNLITFMSTNGLKKICRTSGTFGEVTHRKHLSSLLPPPLPPKPLLWASDPWETGMHTYIHWGRGLHSTTGEPSTAEAGNAKWECCLWTQRTKPQ